MGRMFLTALTGEWNSPENKYSHFHLLFPNQANQVILARSRSRLGSLTTNISLSSRDLWPVEIRLLASPGPGQQAEGPHLPHPGPTQGPLQQTSHRHLCGDPGNSVREESAQDQEVRGYDSPSLSLAVQWCSAVSGGTSGGPGVLRLRDWFHKFYWPIMWQISWENQFFLKANIMQIIFLSNLVQI